MNRRPQRIVVIVGPTAGGKSELAVNLAERLGGQVINADSMQVYRHLDAGTAKPTADQRRRVAHHLVDCVEPTENWTLADWLDAAERVLAELHRRGRLPIVVGGTNLYLKALLEGFFEGPPADPGFRATLDHVPAPQLHQRLAAVDPVAAERIHPNDHKRITRALEVHQLTGRPISALQQQWDQQRRGGYRHDPIMIGLAWPTDLLNRRINARVKAMFYPEQCGLAGVEDLLSETRRLDAAGMLGEQARAALGTRQALDHLAGRITRDQAFERTKIDTRRFAKAQRTWLKRYRDVHWLDASRHAGDALAAQAAAIIARELAP